MSSFVRDRYESSRWVGRACVLVVMTGARYAKVLVTMMGDEQSFEY